MAFDDGAHQSLRHSLVLGAVTRVTRRTLVVTKGVYPDLCTIIEQMQLHQHHTIRLKMTQSNIPDLSNLVPLILRNMSLFLPSKFTQNFHPFRACTQQLLSLSLAWSSSSWRAEDHKASLPQSVRLPLPFPRLFVLRSCLQVTLRQVHDQK